MFSEKRCTVLGSNLGDSTSAQERLDISGRETSLDGRVVGAIAVVAGLSMKQHFGSSKVFHCRRSDGSLQLLGRVRKMAHDSSEEGNGFLETFFQSQGGSKPVVG